MPSHHFVHSQFVLSREMRPPNFLSTTSNRASLSITQTLYDRRALDCTAARPLIQSLQQLMLLTGSSVRVRETLCVDGGLERLVQIMKESCKSIDSTACFKWHLCIQCLLNLGTRGSEKVRRRIFEAGAIPVVATILDNYLVANSEELEFRWRDRNEREVLLFARTTSETSGATASTESASAETNSTSANVVMDVGDTPISIATPAGGASVTAGASVTPSVQVGGVAVAPIPITTIAPGATNNTPSHTPVLAPILGISRTSSGIIIPREQDVYWALEIIAFVSKYSYLRREIQETYLLPQLSLRDPSDIHEHTVENIEMEVEYGLNQEVAIVDLEPELTHNLKLAECIPLEVVEPNPKLLKYYLYDFENANDFNIEYRAKRVNLFELVEHFTKFRTPKEFPYWACIIMRNFVRKDEEGIRQCANFACGKWETFPRQFAKCRRCKRTKYCSKACQLAAWSMHRYWCAPTQSSNTQSHEE